MKGEETEYRHEWEESNPWLRSVRENDFKDKGDRDGKKRQL